MERLKHRMKRNKRDSQHNNDWQRLQQKQPIIDSVVHRSDPWPMTFDPRPLLAAIQMFSSAAVQFLARAKSSDRIVSVFVQQTLKKVIRENLCSVAMQDINQVRVYNNPRTGMKLKN